MVLTNLMVKVRLDSQVVLVIPIQITWYFYSSNLKQENAMMDNNKNTEIEK